MKQVLVLSNYKQSYIYQEKDNYKKNTKKLTRTG